MAWYNYPFFPEMKLGIYFSQRAQRKSQSSQKNRQSTIKKGSLPGGRDPETGKRLAELFFIG
jgi:hypothetical protein